MATKESDRPTEPPYSFKRCENCGDRFQPLPPFFGPRVVCPRCT